MIAKGTYSAAATRVEKCSLEEISADNSLLVIFSVEEKVPRTSTLLTTRTGLTMRNS
jgi:hypothetical protein